MPTPCIVSGTLQTLTSGHIAQGRVIFQLTNIGTGNPVGIPSTSIIPALTYTAMSSQDGTFTLPLWGNDNISPSNTLYAVTFRDFQGNEIGPILYSITGGAVNLNSLAAVSTTIPPVLAPANSGTPGWINVKNFGAAGSGKVNFNVITTAASAVITAPVGTFLASDAGSIIMITRAGASQADLWTTILSFQNSGQVTLAAAASVSTASTLLGQTVAFWGMVDDTAAIQAAINSTFGSPASSNFAGAVVYMPRGVYMISTPINLAGPAGAPSDVPVSFIGDGIFNAYLVASQANTSGTLTYTNAQPNTSGKIGSFAVYGHSRPAATLPVSGAEVALWLDTATLEDIFVGQTAFKYGIHARMTNGIIQNCTDQLGIFYAELDGAIASSCKATGFLTGCNTADAFEPLGSESGTMLECNTQDQGLANMAQTSAFAFNQRASIEQRMVFMRCVGSGGGIITTGFNVNNCDLVGCVGSTGSTNTDFILGKAVNMLDCASVLTNVPTPVLNQSIQGLSLFGANNEQATQWSNSELVTLNTGAAFTDTAGNLLPANAIIDSVVARVTTTITTAANWSLGDATTSTRFTSATGTLTAGTTVVGLNQMQGGVTTNAAGPVQTAAAKVRITLNANPGAGQIRVTVFYRQFIPPTS